MKRNILGYSLFLVIAMCFSFALKAEVIWIDVRSALEHTIDNIAGDIRIPYDEIVQELNGLYPEKKTEIRLYCRSGRRAGVALSALLEAGYRDVKNVGSIGNARYERGISTTR